MRKILLISVLALTLPLWAADGYHSRGHAFEVTVGGGYSSLGYKVNNVAERLTSETFGSYSVQAHIGYSWFFIEYMGISAGVDVQHYGQSNSLNGLLSWNGVTDTDGERYEHRLGINDWSERQDYWNLEVPVSLVFSIPVKDVVYITAQVGGKFGLPFVGTYTGGGDLTHSGYYEPWDLTLTNKPNHGFYSEGNFEPKGDIQKKNYWSIFAKAGVALPLIEHLDLLMQVYFNYALTEIADDGQYGLVGFRNDRPGQEEAHYFMTNYIDMRNTGVISQPAKPWSVGLEVGIRYTIPTKKKAKHPCHCMDDYMNPWHGSY